MRKVQKSLRNKGFLLYKGYWVWLKVWVFITLVCYTNIVGIDIIKSEIVIDKE